MAACKKRCPANPNLVCGQCQPVPGQYIIHYQVSKTLGAHSYYEYYWDTRYPRVYYKWDKLKGWEEQDGRVKLTKNDIAAIKKLRKKKGW